MTLCAALFASKQRTDALGMNPALWPGDEANIAAFPAQVNNHSYVQIDGVGKEGSTTDGGGVSLLTNVDGTAWGFNYGSNDWVNMHWGNGTMGVTVGMESTTCDALANSACSDDSDMSVSFGNVYDWGEIGVHLSMPGDEDNPDTDTDESAMGLGIDYRTDWGFWLFDNTVVHTPDLMGDDLAIHTDFFTHMDAGGADVVFGWGFDYNGASGVASVTAVPAEDCTDDGEVAGDNCTLVAADAAIEGSEAVDVATLTQTATVGVEANLTDWATLRVGYNWSHSLACDNGDAGNDACGSNSDSFAWGLGFNWGGLTADFTVDSSLLQDPVGTITGYGTQTDGLTNKAITLTYSF